MEDLLYQLGKLVLDLQVFASHSKITVDQVVEVRQLVILVSLIYYGIQMVIIYQDKVPLDEISDLGKI